MQRSMCSYGQNNKVSGFMVDVHGLSQLFQGESTPQIYLNRQGGVFELMEPLQPYECQWLCSE